MDVFPAPLQHFTFSIFLTPSAKLETHATAVSDPADPQYGQFWSPEKIAKFTNPHSQDLQQMMSWLQHGGAKATLRTSNEIRVSASVTIVENLLHTTLVTFVHSSTGVLQHMLVFDCNTCCPKHPQVTCSITQAPDECDPNTQQVCLLGFLA